MKKLVVKMGVYIFFILLFLELLVRILNLATEAPKRFIDETYVEKSVPGQKGVAVTGNRRQHFAEYRINSSGFNSYRNFEPTAENIEIALVGDSFIEGFHQNYYNSIGKKIENNVKDVKVYEYGFSGYDMADQLHLINSYKEDFKLIDEIIIYLNYENDLNRKEYVPKWNRLKMLSSTLFKFRNNIELLNYASKIGILAPIKNAYSKSITSGNVSNNNTNQSNEHTELEEDEDEKDKRYLRNFKNLVELYGFDKTKTTLLLDSRKTSKLFIDYCDKNNIRYIDFSKTFQISKKSTTLIYDLHWNNHGRELIADTISKYINSMNN